MKKILLLLVLSTFTALLKAQQLPLAKSADTLSNKLIDNFFRAKPDNTLHWIQPKIKIQPLSSPDRASKSFFGDQVYSNMPVIVLDGSDNMPVAKLDGYYNMPVKHIEIVDSASMSQKQTDTAKTP